MLVPLRRGNRIHIRQWAGVEGTCDSGCSARINILLYTHFQGTVRKNRVVVTLQIPDCQRYL